MTVCIVTCNAIVIADNIKNMYAREIRVVVVN